MTSVPVEVVGPDDLGELAHLREDAFGLAPGDHDRWIERSVPIAEQGRVLAVRDGSRPVAMLQVLAFGQWFGGRCLPMGGLASVAVAPEHRGRSLATALIARAVTDMRDRGEVVSTLHPATMRPYRRAGWEVGALRRIVAVPTAPLAALAPGRGVARRAVPADRAAIEACYAAAAPTRPGWLDRPDWMWSEYLDGDAGGATTTVVEDGEDLVGFARYRRGAATDGHPFHFGLDVLDVVAVDAGVERTLWRIVGHHMAQVPEVRVVGVPTDGLEGELPEALTREILRGATMTRIVDAPGAVAGRGWPTGVEVRTAFDVDDPDDRARGGRYVLEIEGGAGRLHARADTRRGSPGPPVTIGRAGLAAWFTGAASATALARRGLVAGPADTLRALDAAVGGPSPTLVDMF